jgi:hypothetical protein
VSWRAQLQWPSIRPEPPGATSAAGPLCAQGERALSRRWFMCNLDSSWNGLRSPNRMTRTRTDGGVIGEAGDRQWMSIQRD